MAKSVRVYELARQLGMTNAEVIELCGSLGVDVKSHSSGMVEAQADRVSVKLKAKALQVNLKKKKLRLKRKRQKKFLLKKQFQSLPAKILKVKKRQTMFLKWK